MVQMQAKLEALRRSVGMLKREVCARIDSMTLGVLACVVVFGTGVSAAERKSLTPRPLVFSRSQMKIGRASWWGRV